MDFNWIPLAIALVDEIYKVEEPALKAEALTKLQALALQYPGRPLIDEAIVLGQSLVNSLPTTLPTA